MSKFILLSEKTQDVIEQCRMLTGPRDSSLLAFSSFVELTILTAYLQEEASPSLDASSINQKKLEFLRAALRAELLRDLSTAIESNPGTYKKKKGKGSVKFYLLAIAGTIFAACEGFDNITTLLGIFTLPTVAIFSAGLAFAVLSILVFNGVKIVEIANNLEVKLSDAPKLLDLYLAQLTEIKGLRKKIHRYKFSNCSLEDLNELTLVVMMLERRLQGLGESAKPFQEALNNPKMTFAKNLLGGIAGIMFFAGGFASGQTVSMFFLGLVMANVLPTALPVLLFSAAIGFAAFALYWYVEKEGLQQLIGTWLGLDEEKIDKLANQDELNKQAGKLANLKEKIVEAVELTHQFNYLQECVKQREEPVLTPVTKRADFTARPASNNIYSFHQAVTSRSASVLTQDDELATSADLQSEFRLG